MSASPMGAALVRVEARSSSRIEGLSARPRELALAELGLVPVAMADLAAFAQREDLQVVAQAAVAHAQFETVHPFVDGNGRTGRALGCAMLRSKGLVRNTTVPVSAGLLRDVSGYVDALEDFRAGDARPIVERFCEAARFAALSGADLVDQLTDSSTRVGRRYSGHGCDPRRRPGGCCLSSPASRWSTHVTSSSGSAWRGGRHSGPWPS